MQVTQSVVNQSQTSASVSSTRQPIITPNNLANAANNLGVDSATEANAAQKPAQRFQVDERTIALLDAREQEKQQASNSAQQDFAQEQFSQTASGNQLASATSDNIDRINTESTGYDQPPLRNQTAVAAYQAVGNAAQREDISQVFGVDLFA